MSVTRQSWPNLRPFPAQRVALSLQREFTHQELERIRQGFLPQGMEDKWVLFTEEDTLYIHRSWTGYCIYRLRLTRQGDTYRVLEASANRDPAQYQGSNDSYDAKLLLFLIEHLLLGKRTPLPVDTQLAAGIMTELHHQHVLGAGQREPARPIQVTLGGVIGWFWQWLRWLAGR